jgi:xanthine dehydrogenase accessory factor
MNDNPKIAYWKKVLSLLNKGQNVFIAMVVDHTIHSPGTTGAKLLVKENKEMMGTIGGGIMEFTLVNRAYNILNNGNFTPEIQSLDHKKTGTDEQSGMICAGKQTNLYYVCEPEKDGEIVDKIVQNLTEGQSAILSISPEGMSLHKQELENHDSQYSFTQSDDHWCYQEQLKNYNRIAILGGGHCSLALSRVMKNLGYDVFVFETRGNISTLGENNFVDTTNILDDFKDAASQLSLPENTQVVVMTTDVPNDVRGLLGLLDFPFPFIGVMGSVNKISEIKKQLQAENISDQQLSRIVAPVGLAMVSNTPEEIAISVAAQLLQLRNESPN